MALTNLQLGSLVLNTELLVALAAGMMGLLAVKLRLRDWTERDTSPAWNAIGIWIAVWKGSLLLTDPAGVINQPLSLLYYDGGAIGFWLACLSTAVYLVFKFGRRYGRAEGYVVTGSFAAGFSIVYLIAKIAVDPASIQFGHWFGLFAALAAGVWLTGFGGAGASRGQGNSDSGQREGSGRRLEESGQVGGNNKVQDGMAPTLPASNRGNLSLRRALQAAGILLVLALLSSTAHGQMERMLEAREARGDTAAVGPRIGHIAPPIELDGLTSGERISLEALKGKTVLVNFWTTWCRVCMTEMPHVRKLHEQYMEQGADVAILSVNVTSQEQGAEKVSRYAEQRSLSFPIALDQQGETADDYQVRAYPSTFIVDSEGVVRDRFIGAISYADMRERIDRVRD